MGTDKAFLRLGNVTLLEHAIATAKEVCATIALVGDQERLASFGSVVEDRFAGQGPLAGIHAALNSEFSSELNLVVAVDTPALSAELLQYLVTSAQASSATVTAIRANTHVQPLCAVYGREFGATAEKALLAGRNKIEPLFSDVPVHIIEEYELKAVGFAPDIFDNVNTPEDWERIQRRLGVINR